MGTRPGAQCAPGVPEESGDGLDEGSGAPPQLRGSRNQGVSGYSRRLVTGGSARVPPGRRARACARSPPPDSGCPASGLPARGVRGRGAGPHRGRRWGQRGASRAKFAVGPGARAVPLSEWSWAGQGGGCYPGLRADVGVGRRMELHGGGGSGLKKQGGGLCRKKKKKREARGGRGGVSGGRVRPLSVLLGAVVLSLTFRAWLLVRWSGSLDYKSQNAPRCHRPGRGVAEEGR